MYIKKLLLDGFKSFPKKTEIIFDKGLNIIVGPNGSGKSNIIDAICFVLGRLGMKSMRVEKASNLIFYGTKNVGTKDEAKVELFFDNSDKVFSLDGDVKISRILKKDGTSIYKINDETKTRQEILDLLAQAGIDPYGFNIILQGEISNFVEIHAEERRKIIEEVAGISVYETRKEASLRELQKTEQKLAEVYAVLKEREAYMKNLEKEKEEALRYKRLEQEIARDKASIIARQLEETKKEQELLIEEIKKKENSAMLAKEKLGELQNFLAETRKKIEEINKEIEKASKTEEARKEISEAATECASFSARLEHVSSQLSELEEKNVLLRRDIEKIEKEIKEKRKEEGKEAKITLDELKKIIGEIAKKLEEICKKITKIKKREKTEKIVEEIKNESARLKNLIFLEIEEKDVETKIKEKELARIISLLKGNAKEKEQLLKKKEELEKILEEKKKLLGLYEEKEKELREKFQKLFSSREMLEENILKKESEILKEQLFLANLQEELNEMKIKKAEINAKISVLEEKFSSYNVNKIIKASPIILEERIKKNEERLAKIGSVNWRALEVYKQIKVQYDEIAEKARKLEEEKASIIKIIEEIDRKKKNVFMLTLEKINEHFMKNYSALAGKGSASLQLENKKSPFDGGLDIIVKLEKGKCMDVSALSGGERVLVALSLIFAIQEYKPHFFYILDEVDAALDKRNSEKFATLFEQHAKKAQYIIITHNDIVIEKSHVLYGISMQDGISKIFSIKI